MRLTLISSSSAAKEDQTFTDVFTDVFSDAATAGTNHNITTCSYAVKDTTLTDSQIKRDG